MKDIGGRDWRIKKGDRPSLIAEKDGKVCEEVSCGKAFTERDLKKFVLRENERALRSLRHDKPPTTKKRRRK